MALVNRIAHTAWAIRLLLIALALAACSPTPAPVAAVPTAAPTSTASPTHTAALTVTVTATATPTHTATSLPPTATNTRTSTPSPTHTSTSTLTPTATNTRPPAATFTPVPPTATDTAVPVGAQVFADTVHYPFERNSFVKELDRVKFAMQEYLKQFGYANHFGSASCFAVTEYRGKFRNALGFADVPPDWYPLYVEIWATIRDAYTLTQPIDDICKAGGGPLSDNLYWTVANGMDAAQYRLYVVQQQAAALP